MTRLPPLQAGADPHKPTRLGGSTALDLAAENYHVAVARELVQWGQHLPEDSPTARTLAAVDAPITATSSFSRPLSSPRQVATEHRPLPPRCPKIKFCCNFLTSVCSPGRQRLHPHAVLRDHLPREPAVTPHGI